jgi:hypothetical protein
VDVGVVLLVVADEGVDDLFGLLGRGRAVEVDERFAVHALLQDREVGANALGQHGASS